MNAPTRFPKSLGLHEEALRDAEEAGVCRSDVATLIEIGEAFADFAHTIAPKLMSLTDGRMMTVYPQYGGEVRQCANFAAENLRAVLIEAALEHLDHYDVALTASVIRSMRASEVDRQARVAPVSAVQAMCSRELGS